MNQVSWHTFCTEKDTRPERTLPRSFKEVSGTARAGHEGGEQSAEENSRWGPHVHPSPGPSPSSHRTPLSVHPKHECELSTILSLFFLLLRIIFFLQQRPNSFPQTSLQTSLLSSPQEKQTAYISVPTSS